MKLFRRRLRISSIKGKIKEVFFTEAEVAAGNVEVWDLDAEEGFEKRPFNWLGFRLVEVYTCKEGPGINMIGMIYDARVGLI